MLKSMTAFASRTGASDRFTWSWDLRAVNGKGLDLRLRVPDWIDGLEAGLRARLGKALDRGNVTVSLRLQAGEATQTAKLDEAHLEAALDAMAEIEARAMTRGLSLAPATAADLLAVRGVFEPGGEAETDTAALCEALLADFEPVLADFLDMRAAEGQALSDILLGQIARIATLTESAEAAAEARRPQMEAAFRSAMARVLQDGAGDEARIAQELAILAVKADVTEEIDRLHAHVGAARDLLAQGSPVGRKLDFLSQEFNREANTLCSKAQNTDLGAVGLDLKAAIERMREQVQNVE
ncbi:YicC/YloC family endoribonuclease [Roseovarius aestuariivivens]|uniref:YicC/YloC family endoribonuclease n=1 Tax=Roseovarius aestuariivivens TaxID=1888910 RepID=UPI001FDABEA9|nr:YicC/YloC family endoribonuclease [Roseovarius aestuariivivens]